MFDAKSKSPLAKLILSELSALLDEVERDTKQRNSVKKYLSEMKNAYERSDAEATSRLLLRKTKGQLLSLYPTATETLDKLSIDLRRHSEQASSSLLDRFQEYCERENTSCRGNMPRLFIDSLVEVHVDEEKRRVKVGRILIKALDWDKVSSALDGERHRIWGREFSPLDFRNSLLSVHSALLGIKPNPVGWVRLDDVYQSLRVRIEEENPNWRKGGRLVAYYKDEFSADLSKLWMAQVDRKIDPPRIEFSGIRDPRLSYKLVLPDGQIESYGHLRPLQEAM